MALILQWFIPTLFGIGLQKSFLNRCSDIAFLADLMGHESIETTRIYLRKTATEQRTLVDNIVDWLKRASVLKNEFRRSFLSNRFSTLARLACILFCSANGGIHINVFAISRIYPIFISNTFCVFSTLSLHKR